MRVGLGWMRVLLFCGSVALAGALACAAQSSSVSKPTAEKPVCESIVVPSYFYPVAGSGWDDIIAAPPKSKRAGRVLILNPNSGPGAEPNADYRRTVAAAHASGQKMYGYVATGYGKVPVDTAEEQVRKYIDWYGVNGIFVDEVSSEATEVAPYYQPLASFITAQLKGGGVILNNGTYPDASYAEISVPQSATLQIVVFEHEYASFTAGSFTVPAWIHKHPASMFINIVYDVPDSQVAKVLRLSIERNVGGVYVTDKTLPNPYNTLPSYWKSLDRMVRAECHNQGK